MQSLPSLEGVTKAEKRLKGLIRVTPLEFSKRLSNITNSSILLKREDVQQIRSFKIRGAYNKISSLDEKTLKMELYVPVLVIMRKDLLFHVKN